MGEGLQACHLVEAFGPTGSVLTDSETKKSKFKVVVNCNIVNIIKLDILIEPSIQV